MTSSDQDTDEAVAHSVREIELSMKHIDFITAGDPELPYSPETMELIEVIRAWARKRAVSRSHD